MQSDKVQTCYKQVTCLQLSVLSTLSPYQRTPNSFGGAAVAAIGAITGIFFKRSSFGGTSGGTLARQIWGGARIHWMIGRFT